VSVQAALPNGCAAVPVVFARYAVSLQKFRGPHSELCLLLSPGLHRVIVMRRLI